MNKFRVFGVIVCVLCLHSAMQAQTIKEAIPNLISKELEGHLHSIMYVQVEAWNRGDIAEFMKPYWKDERLTFSSGGQTQRGWEKTYQQYKAKYPDRATMGTLRFSELESQTLGPDSVLTLGKWQLDREKPVGGNFSLVWKRMEGDWVIIHDHSSAKTP